ncbi:ABC transporter substrate-binding protein [Streptomyces avermitilis]|uniref:ABC transporter substrate-binding protein n=1 Tax=Streptomyces avermitilis TaxID=33903 RepID=UPI0033A79C66
MRLSSRAPAGEPDRHRGDVPPPWWRRRWGITAIASAFVLVAATIVVLTRSDPNCGPDNPDLYWVGSGANRECIGLMSEHAYAFDPGDKELTGILERIAAENERVRNAWDKPESDAQAVPYVKVAVLTPMTGNERTALPLAQIKETLKGAYTAQCRLNKCPELVKNSDGPLSDVVGPRPNIQLIVASEGRTQTHWKTVVGQLARMTGGDHPVVAVTGMGISIGETRDAAAELTKQHLPSVGAVISATDLDAGEFFKVSPSNEDSAKALHKYFRSIHPALGKGYLIYDSKADNFTRSLRDGFEKQFKDEIHGRAGFRGQTIPQGKAMQQLFTPIVTNVCMTNAKAIFYAGRSRDLPALVSTLAGNPCTPRRPLTIFTCSTGLWGAGQDKKLSRQLSSSGITVVDASATDPKNWMDGKGEVPEGFPPFYKAWRALKFNKEDLWTGYGTLEHDAFLVAGQATRNAYYGQNTPGDTPQPAEEQVIPNSEDVAGQIINLSDHFAVRAASGTISFDATNVTHGWPLEKPIPITIVPREPESSPPVYKTARP